MKFSDVQLRSTIREDGFSFLELIAGIFVLALIATALTSSIHLGIRTWQRFNSSETAPAQTYLAQRALRQFVECVRALPVDASQPKSQLWFSGGNDRLRFASQMPSQFGLGGSYAVTIDARSNSSGSKDLLLVVSAFNHDQKDWPSPARAEQDETVVLQNIAGIEMRYFGDPVGGNEPHWVSSWTGHASVPQLIAVDVTFLQNDRRLWPTLMVAPIFREGRL